ARSALVVPGPAADVDPQASGPALLVVVPVMVLARQLQPEQPRAASRGVVPTDEQDRTVFPLGVVLLVGHPGPDDLTRIRLAVRVWGVVDLQRSSEVTRIHRRFADA